MPGQPAQATQMGKGASGVWPQHHRLDSNGRGCQMDGGHGASAPARQDSARLLPKAAAGLSEAGGGQAASSQDGPPTRHIRAAGLSPGPVQLRPLALTRNTPPYGFPRGGRKEEKNKPGARESHTSLWTPGTLPGLRGGEAGTAPSSRSEKSGRHPSRKWATTTAGAHEDWGLPVFCMQGPGERLPGLDLNFKRPEPWVTSRFSN